MGIKERLESIRAHNEASRDEFSSGVAREAEAIGPPGSEIGDKGGVISDVARRGKATDRLALNPWLTIWTRPAATIRAIIATDPGHHVLAIAMLVGFGRALTRAEARNLGDHLTLLGVVGVCAVLGPLFALISLYLGGEVLRVIGGWLGGRARAAEVRAALAWSSVPQLVVLLLWFPPMLMFGNEVFTKAKPFILSDLQSRYALSAILLADLILLSWSFILGIVCLAASLRISVWRIVATIALSAGVLFGTMFVLLFPVLSEMARALLARRAAPAVAPVMRPAPIHRARSIARDSKRPPDEYGPAVAAIWDEGCEIDASVDRDQPGHPVVGLSIAWYEDWASERALRHLRELPDLRSLEISFAKGFSDAGMQHLRGLHHLQKLSIGLAYYVTDAGLENLSEMTALRTLNLFACEQVTGTGLVHLEDATELRTLTLFGCGMTAEGLASVQNLTSLKELNIGGMQLDDSSLVHLEGLIGLEKLSLGGKNPIRGPGLVHLKSLPSLRELDLSNGPVTDEAIDTLADLKGLRQLDLGGTRITPAGLERLREALPGVEIFPKRPTARESRRGSRRPARRPVRPGKSSVPIPQGGS